MVLHDHVATTYGIHRNSVLNQSKYFHVTDGLVPDIMHDILEGCLPYETKELLKCFVLDQQLITLNELNSRIESFPYNYVDVVNKPTPIASLTSSDHSLKQNGEIDYIIVDYEQNVLCIYVFTCMFNYAASQMWCLARLLPLMIGDIVPEHSEHWECFLSMLTIVDYAFAPVTSAEIVPYLKTLIKEHHECFCAIYPLCTVIPKLHYVIHLPDFMLRCDLVHSWCLKCSNKCFVCHLIAGMAHQVAIGA